MPARLGCEGIVSKRLGSRYRSGRSPDWLKFKNPAAPAVRRREAEEDWVWNDVVQPYFLEQPTELVLVIIGAVLVLLGSKKKPSGARSARRNSLSDA